jgi:hypothetical protein
MTALVQGGGGVRGGQCDAPMLPQSGVEKKGKCQAKMAWSTQQPVCSRGSSRLASQLQIKRNPICLVLCQTSPLAAQFCFSTLLSPFLVTFLLLANTAPYTLLRLPALLSLWLQVENRSRPTFVIDLRVTRARTSQVHGGTLGSESPLRRIDHRLPFPTKFPPGLFHTSHKCCSPRPDRRLKPGSYRPQSALDHDQLKPRVPWYPERERRRLSLPPRATMTASPNSLDPSSPDPPASYPHE